MALDPSQFSIPVWNTKFYVVNDASTNQTYDYDAAGGSIENYSLITGNTTPRGAASNVTGDTIWVADKSRQVFVYDWPSLPCVAADPHGRGRVDFPYQKIFSEFMIPF